MGLGSPRGLLPGCWLPSGWAARTRRELGAVRPCGGRGDRGGGARGVGRCAGAVETAFTYAEAGEAAPGAFPAETQAQRACREQAARKGCGRNSGCGVTRRGQRAPGGWSRPQAASASQTLLQSVSLDCWCRAGLKSRKGLRFSRSDREGTPRSMRQTRGSEVV